MELKHIKVGDEFLFGTNEGELFIGSRLNNKATVYITENAWVTAVHSR